MVGDGNVFKTAFARALCHRFNRRDAVTPFGMTLQIAF
jgi:hypothetical protein